MRRITVIGLVIVIMLIPVMGLNCDSNNGPPSDWKCYQNEEHQFQFYYPEDWEESDIAGTEIAVLSPDDGGYQEHVNVIVESSIGMSLDEYIGVTEYDFLSSIPPDSIIENENYANANGMKGYEWVVKYTQYHIAVQVKIVVFIANDKAYNITYWAFQSTYDDYIDIFDTLIDYFEIW